MFSSLTTAVAKVLVSPLIGLMMLAGYQPALVQQAPLENLGASNAIETPIALFETSLQNSISSAATTMTLVSATTRDGTTLASSTYAFIIDEGTASQEFVIADCTGVTCTNMQRGLSVVDGTTTVAALAKEHRRGASVKITDGPILVKLTRIANGIGTFPNALSYTSHPTFTADTHIVDKKYVDDTAFSGAGVIDATSAARGVVELATQIETASSSSAGTSGNLAIPASNATSTYNSATAALRVVVTQNDGKIDSNFLNLGSLGTTSIILSTTSVVGFPSVNISDIGKNRQIFTSSGTFTVPLGVELFRVRIQGPGRAGGNGGLNSNCAGGGAGGYLDGIFDLTATTSVGVFIDSDVARFSSIASSTAGDSGGCGSSSQFTGANGGTAFATTSSFTVSALAVPGGSSQGAGSNGTVTYNATSGANSQFGGGGLPTQAGRGYGSGGGGGTSPSTNGGNGAPGIVIIDW